MSLFDFLQGASNAAASNISGPIDLLGAGLRFVGVPVPEDALLSSKWMEQRGLTRKPQNQMAGLLGEAAGLSAPIAAAAKAPQIAAGLLNTADDFQRYNKALGPAGASQAVVWHGSPHKFDKFDSSKIGTGEGAQAYGHGLYLAESPGVAKSYQTALSGRGDAAGAAARYLPARQFNAEEIAAIHRAATGDDPINLAARRLGYRQASLRDVDEAALTKAIADVREQAAGSLYKVDLPDDMIARMLDWDAPVKQQAESVKDALYSVAQGRYMTFPSGERRFIAAPDAHMSGGAAYARAARLLEAGDAKASATLRAAGVPGIRYLDGGSRGTGSGTSNFVVFPGEERMLRILERNGNPLLMP